jgi:hypothetical protein
MFKAGFEKVAVSRKWVNERVVGGLATRAGFRRRGGMHRAMVEAAGKANSSSARFFPNHVERFNVHGINKATKGNSRTAGAALRHHQAMDRARQQTSRASDEMKKAAGRRSYFNKVAAGFTGTASVIPKTLGKMTGVPAIKPFGRPVRQFAKPGRQALVGISRLNDGLR